MTEMRDFDRLTRAWLDLMPDEAPDRVIDAVLQAVEVTRQAPSRPRWALWRLPQMNRFSLAAAAVVLVAIIAGGSVVLSNFKVSGVGGPATSPAPSPAPSETPLAQGQGRGVGFVTTAPTVFLGATWITDVQAIQGLFHDSRLRLVTGSSGERFSVTYSTTAAPMASQPVTEPPGYLGLVSTVAGSGCNVGDYGVYELNPSTDGASVTLVVVSDACSTRASVLGRTWTRWLGTVNEGGRGVVTAFAPMFELELPRAHYAAASGTDGATIDGGSRSFVAVKNPRGVSDPCRATPGAPLQIAPNAAAFLAYLRTLPGFDVQTAPFTIDGRPGVRVTIPVAKSAACQATGRVFEWTDGTPGNLGWFIRQGDTDVLYLVNVGKDVYLLQWLGDGVTAAEEQQVLSTIHFIDALPTGS
jgi:hypothetical protein